MQQEDIVTIRAILAILDFAESLPIELLTIRNTKPYYPETIGEHLVNYTLHQLITHEWSSDDIESMIMDIESILGELDRGVDNLAAWNSLFASKKTCYTTLHEVSGS